MIRSALQVLVVSIIVMLVFRRFLHGIRGVRKFSVLGAGEALEPLPRYKPWHQTLSAGLTKDKRIIMIGDIHGCFDEFQLLLQRLNYKKANDIVVLVGDLVAKGPKSVECVQKARELGCYAVLGNHDYYVVSSAEGADFGITEHREIAQKLPKEDLEWLGGLPTTIFLEQYNTIVVHAGLDPKVNVIEENLLENMLHMRSIDGDGEVVSTASSSSEPWAHVWKGPFKVIFGHDAVRGLQKKDYALGLDTGCVYGRQLSAYVLPSEEIIQVDALRAYKNVSAL